MPWANISIYPITFTISNEIQCFNLLIKPDHINRKNILKMKSAFQTRHSKLSNSALQSATRGALEANAWRELESPKILKDA